MRQRGDRVLFGASLRLTLPGLTRKIAPGRCPGKRFPKVSEQNRMLCAVDSAGILPDDVAHFQPGAPHMTKPSFALHAEQTVEDLVKAFTVSNLDL